MKGSRSSSEGKSKRVLTFSVWKVSRLIWNRLRCITRLGGRFPRTVRLWIDTFRRCRTGKRRATEKKGTRISDKIVRDKNSGRKTERSGDGMRIGVDATYYRVIHTGTLHRPWSEGIPLATVMIGSATSTGGIKHKTEGIIIIDKCRYNRPLRQDTSKTNLACTCSA